MLADGVSKDRDLEREGRWSGLRLQSVKFNGFDLSDKMSAVCKINSL